MPETPLVGDREVVGVGCSPIASSDRHQQTKVHRDSREAGRQQALMAFWTALLLGALGGMATIFALRAVRANSLALPNEDGPSRQAGQDHGRRSSARVLSGDRGPTRLEIREKHQEGGTTADAVLPRILTVLTTYYKRSPLIKEYKEAVADRDDGYEPTVFVVSNLDDEDPYDVIDFKVGSPTHHRSIAAIAEATLRYNGTFDWIALGDDDTAFMYNRARNFLSHIDHTKPVVFARVDGMNSTLLPVYNAECYPPEAKRAPVNQSVANGCCEDFASSCEVPVFPRHIEARRRDMLRDYGPDGLFWGYGGSGIFLSAGLVVDVVGAEGWALCERMFIRMNTDVQVAQCLKMHGYSMGSYPQGFGEIGMSAAQGFGEVETKETPAAFDVSKFLANNCEILGFHLAVNHQPNARPYTAETFRAAVSSVRDVDVRSARDGEDPTSYCHESWASFGTR